MKKFITIFLAGVITLGISVSAYSKSSSLNKKGAVSIEQTNPTSKIPFDKLEEFFKSAFKGN